MSYQGPYEDSSREYCQQPLPAGFANFTNVNTNHPMETGATPSLESHYKSYSYNAAPVDFAGDDAVVESPYHYGLTSDQVFAVAGAGDYTHVSIPDVCSYVPLHAFRPTTSGHEEMSMDETVNSHGQYPDPSGFQDPYALHGQDGTAEMISMSHSATPQAHSGSRDMSESNEVAASSQYYKIPNSANKTYTLSAHNPSHEAQSSSMYRLSCPRKCGVVLTGQYAQGNMTRHLKTQKCLNRAGKERDKLECRVDGCSKLYARSDALKNHINKVHGGTVEDDEAWSTSLTE